MPGIIDVHAHDYPDAYLRAVRDPANGFEHYVREDGRVVVLQDGAVALAVPQPMPTVEERLARMDEADISVQIVSLSAPNVYRIPTEVRQRLTSEVNDALLASAAEAKDRLKVFVSLPLPDVDAALAELERIRQFPGTVGVIVCSTIDRMTLDDPAFTPLWRELSRRRAIVFVHPTTACCTDGLREYALALGIDFLAETTLAISRLVYSGHLERFDGIRWIFAHLGGMLPFVIHRLDNYFHQFPECRQNITRLPSELLKSVYFDTVSTHIPALRCAFQTFGIDQFLFGSDFPHVPGGIKRFVEALGQSGLSAEELESVKWRTARALIEPAAASPHSAR